MVGEPKEVLDLEKLIKVGSKKGGGMRRGRDDWAANCTVHQMGAAPASATAVELVESNK